jgi:hypothetical protein
VQDHFIYDYAVIRVVPKVEREEFINVGVILSCPEKEFLEAVIELDEQKLKTLDPEFDIETAKTHLAAFPVICEGGTKAGEIGRLTQKERFNWLTSPKSTIIQTSPVHTGYCKNPARVLEHLVNTMVRKSQSNK